MNIAVLSDIHGNIFALKSVYKEIKLTNIDYVFVLGDMVGYYYFAVEVLNLLNNLSPIMIKGNHERMLENVLLGKEDIDLIRQKYGSGLEYALRNLDKEGISKLITLPSSERIEIDNRSFLLFHGSPWDSDYYIYPDEKKTIIEKCFEEESDFVLLGHTHYQFTYYYNNKVLINPGSVGQSRKTGGVANWCIINTNDKSVKQKSTLYDPIELIDISKKLDPNNPYLWEVLVRK